MRRTGNLPKFMTKYCVPRYGTSYEAEHRHERADELGNHKGQVFYEDHSQNLQPSHHRWTTSDSYGWYIVSNLGLVGAPWDSLEYEEDFFYRQTQVNDGETRYMCILGGYLVVARVEAGGGFYDEHNKVTKIDSGKEVVLNWGISSQGIAISDFSVNQISAGNSYIFGEETIDVWLDVNRNAPANYVSDNNGYAGAIYRYVGRPEGVTYKNGARNVSGVHLDYSLLSNTYGPVMMHGLCVATSYPNRHWHHNTLIQGSTLTISNGRHVAQIDCDNSLDGRNIGSDELLGRNAIVTFSGYDSDNYLFSFERNESIPTDRRINDRYVYDQIKRLDGQSVAGRAFVGSRNDLGGESYDFIGYVAPDEESYRVEKLTEGVPVRLNGFGPSEVFARAVFNTVIEGTVASSSRLLFEGKFISELSDAHIAGVFGTSFFNYDTKILTNAETGEENDLHEVIPDIEGNLVRGFRSSGEKGTMLVIQNQTSFIDENGNRRTDYYIVSESHVFKVSKVFKNGSEQAYDERYGVSAYPCWKHAREIIVFYEQIVYKIRKDGFTAYDMQTFMRLDNLPGFQSAVEKIWEREWDQ